MASENAASTNVSLIVDMRETQLISLLTDKTTLTTANLPLGDILVKRGDITLLLIERKSVADLVSSIKDGRYEEQSFRLMNCAEYERHTIIYLIEGVIGNRDRKLVLSALFSLGLFKGFSIMRTMSIADTAEHLIELVAKLTRDFQKGRQLYTTLHNVVGDVEPVDYTAAVAVKKVKRENITPENINVLMLMQIPGVSNITATAILNKFGTIEKLICDLRTNPNALDDIFTNAGGKNRRLPVSVREAIGKYLVPPLRTEDVEATDAVVIEECIQTV